MAAWIAFLRGIKEGTIDPQLIHPSRRRFLQALLVAGGVCKVSLRAEGTVPAVRAITRGPRFHWFGYYDKQQFDPTSRYVLGMAVDFEHRSPRPDDVIRVGMVDLHDGDRWIELGESRAWGWQQGCMLQWRPGSASEVLWNDREGARFVCRVLDVRSGKQRTLPRAVYALDPGGRWAVGTEFARIQDLRPGYGYAGIDDPSADVRAPAGSGIYRIDLETGEHRQIVSLGGILRIPHGDERLDESWHWFNHLLVNTDGSRFTFLHRWRKELGERAQRAGGGFVTRMLTADPDGANVYVIDPSGHTSHFIWRDPQHILAWTRVAGKDGFYLLEDGTRNVQAIGEGVMTRNGHQTYVPRTNNEWILNDTYPDRADRKQTLYLYHVPTNRRIDLGRFHSPPQYAGEWRCDLHPRSSPDGRLVVIDSPHGSNGRQMYLIDVGTIVDAPI
ncbi:MAG: hypothetical protein GEU99_07490 [Luteitalea sp.]|nr:hypothetical protein [Luteitalea sp.]